MPTTRLTIDLANSGAYHVSGAPRNLHYFVIDRFQSTHLPCRFLHHGR